MKLDFQLFSWLNGLAGQNAILDEAARLLGNEFFMPSTFGLLLLGLWIATRDARTREKNQKAIISTVLALALVTFLVHMAYFIYQRPRPFLVHEVNLLITPPSDPSFPSNSTSVAFSIAASVWIMNRPLGSILLIPASLVALSRVFMGVHYPSDILGGAAFGFLSAFASWYFLRRFPVISDSIIRTTRKLFLA